MDTAPEIPLVEKVPRESEGYPERGGAEKQSFSYEEGHDPYLNTPEGYSQSHEASCWHTTRACERPPKARPTCLRR
jgi:hypothetical protein